jgi:MFS family permease
MPRSTAVYFWLFLVATTLDLSAVALVVPFMRRFVLAIGIDAKYVGAVQAIYGLLQTIAVPLAATLGDADAALVASHGAPPPPGGFSRLRRLMNALGLCSIKHSLLVVSAAGTATANFLLFSAISQTSVALFFAARFLVGAIRHTMSVGAAVVLDSLPAPSGADDGASTDSGALARWRQRRARRLLMFNSSASLGFALAPMVGGLILDHFGLAALAATAVVLGVCSSVLFYVATPYLVLHRRDANATAAAAIPAASRPPTTADGAAAPTNPFRVLWSLLSTPRTPEQRLLLLAVVANSCAYVMAHGHNELLLTGAFGFTASAVGVVTGLGGACNTVGQALALPSAKALRLTPRSFVVLGTVLASVVGCGLTLVGALGGSGVAPEPLASWLGSEAGAVFSARAALAGLLLTSFFAGSVDTIARSALAASMVAPDDQGRCFGAGACMSLVGSIDGANRVLMPLLASRLVESARLAGIGSGVQMPSAFVAAAACAASALHLRAGTGSELTAAPPRAVVFASDAKKVQ